MFQQAESILECLRSLRDFELRQPGHHAPQPDLLAQWILRRFGTGAYSYVNGVRARNAITTDAYLRNPGQKIEALALGPEEERLETLIQHFRLRDGLPERPTPPDLAAPSNRTTASRCVR